jgi:hypothetical protein
MVAHGLAATGLRGGRAAARSRAPTTPEIGDIAKGPRRPVRGDQRGLSLAVDPASTRSTSTSRTSSRATAAAPGLTFAPGGRVRAAAARHHKMVSEDDLIRTGHRAYGAGWRQVKLYFMCGSRRDRRRRAADRRPRARGHPRRRRAAAGADIRCTVSIGGFVPKPHTPFQWAAQLAPRHRPRLALLRERDPRRPQLGRPSASATTTASPGSSRACSRAVTAGGPGDPPVGRTAALRRLDEHFSYERGSRGRAAWRTPSTSTGTRRASATQSEVLPGTTSTSGSTRTGSGRTGRTPSPRSRSTTAAGPRASTAGLPAERHPHPGRPERPLAAAASMVVPRSRPPDDASRSCCPTLVPVRGRRRVKALLPPQCRNRTGSADPGHLCEPAPCPTRTSSGATRAGGLRPYREPSPSPASCCSRRAATTTRTPTCRPTCSPSSVR